MCASCLNTAADVLLIPGGVAAYAATNAVRAFRGKRRGQTAVERRQERWEDDAEFLRELGHDPVEVLGPAPRG